MKQNASLYQLVVTGKMLTNKLLFADYFLVRTIMFLSVLPLQRRTILFVVF